MHNGNKQNLRPDFKKGFGLSFLILSICSLLTWLIVSNGADLSIQSRFFTPGAGWAQAHDQPWQILYEYGTLPGLLLSIGALVVLALGLVKSAWRPYRRIALTVVLTSILGAGLLVNAVLKPYCGRPRPREIQNFGGQWTYCAPCQDSPAGQGMSFPCGHCTMGYLFVTLFFLKRRTRWPAIAGGTAGLAYGTLLGAARAVQGAHFATDTLWSLAVMLTVALLSHYILAPWIERWLGRLRRWTGRRKAIAGLAAVVAIAAITTGFLTRRPYFDSTVVPLPVTDTVRRLVIVPDVDVAIENVRYTGTVATLAISGQGFGWLKAKERVQVTFSTHQDVLTATATTQRYGYFAELQHRIDLTLPASLKDRVTVLFSPRNGG